MRILIVTAHDDRSYIHRLIDLGIEGFMLKDELLSTYARAIRDVAGGAMYFSPHVARVALTSNGSGRIVLSTREYEVLRLVATGLTSVAIGSRLCIAPKTVDTYAERACQKLGASNRASAVARAVELGLITTDADEQGRNGG